MANTKSAKKRVRQTIRKTARNKGRKSQVKTALKKAYGLIQEGSEGAADQLKDSVVEAVSVVMKAASKGILHKKTAARRVSRLTKALNAVGGIKTSSASNDEVVAEAPKTTVKKKATAKKKPAAKKKAAVKKKASTRKK